MPVYRYVCGKTPKENRCKIGSLSEEFFNGEDVGVAIDFDERYMVYADDGRVDAEKSTIVQLVSHTMAAKPEVFCPVCKSEAIRVIGKTGFYMPGNCYLNKADCKRHIALEKLEKDDPYGSMRAEGDKEFLIKKIKRFGKNPKRSFYPGGKGGLSIESQHRPGT